MTDDPRDATIRSLRAELQRARAWEALGVGRSGVLSAATDV